MREIRHHLERRQAEFAGHPFFSSLSAGSLGFAPGLAFWVMVFQDLLRLNEERVKDPAMKKIARHHRSGDAGHERWFLDDMRCLEVAPDAELFFGPRYTATRDAAYSLMTEVFRAGSDVESIVLLLALESAGCLFFERVTRALAASPYSGKLKYFSDMHLDAEIGHEEDIEADLERSLYTIDLGPEQRAGVAALVDRVFAALSSMLSGLEASALAPPQALPDRRQVG